MTSDENKISWFARACLEEAAKKFSVTFSNNFEAIEDYRSKIGIVISIIGAKIGGIEESAPYHLMCRGKINGDTADILIHLDKDEIDSVEMYFQDGDSLVNWNGEIDQVDFGEGFV
jgi:hypothetical protein